jgi:hypothetical protein
MKIVNGKDKLALGALVLSLSVGAWLVVAPFVEGYQARGSAWGTGTKNDVVVGLSLLALSTGAIVVFAAGGLRELARRKEARL